MSHFLWLLSWCALAVGNEPVYPHIRTVHVINSCHLDIGFADSSAGIINRYFDHHLPYAASVGDDLRKGVSGFTDNKLGFMFQSWVIDLFLSCPEGMGLHCPNSTQKAKIGLAIAKGDITWHAFPHNAQLEVMGPALIKAGLELTFALDKQFGLPNKTTLSQRDVPGLTRALIPLLRSKGVTAVSVGANDGSTPAKVPPCFLWQDGNSNQSMLVLYNWPGYGRLPISHQRNCVVDGFDHALVLNFNGDNAGPSPASSYGQQWQNIAKSFPNAQIVASTFDNFTEKLEAVKSQLPVVCQEIGDSWVYGVPSDPQKVSRMRVVNRAFSKIDGFHSIENLLMKDHSLRNATRFFLKLGEHTWGKDVKSNLVDNTNWTNKDFQKAKRDSHTASQYNTLENSWWEQRHWGITVGMHTLAKSTSGTARELLSMLKDGFDKLQPHVPDTHGFAIAAAGDRFKCGSIELSFGSSGAITHLVHEGRSWSDEDHQLFSLKYRSYSAADVAAFFATYCMFNASWVQHDYGKPGLPKQVLGKFWEPQLQALYVKRSGPSCSFLLQTSYELEAVTEYGAASGWTTMDVMDGVINVSVNMFNKSTTRLPEAMFVQLDPIANGGEWSAHKIGSWIRADEIVDGGSKHLHGIMEPGVKVRASDGKQMSVSALDAGVVSFGNLTAYPSPVHQDPDTAAFGASYLLWDNLWGTNYVMWWPFVVPPPPSYASSSEYFPDSWNNDMISRFTVEFPSTGTQAPQEFLV